MTDRSSNGSTTIRLGVGHIKNRRRRALYYYRALLVYSLVYPNVRHYPKYPMPSLQSRNFLFTIQYSAEPPAVPSAVELEAVCKYMCYQSEMAPTTGQLHIQGFIHYAKKVTPMTCKADVCRLFGVLLLCSTRGAISSLLRSKRRVAIVS